MDGDADNDDDDDVSDEVRVKQVIVMSASRPSAKTDDTDAMPCTSNSRRSSEINTVTDKIR